MEIFRPEEQDSAMGVLILRTNVDLSGLAPALRREVTAARFDVREIVAVADVMDRSVAKPRFTAVVVALFGGLGLVLTMSGVYGMLAFVVRKRRHEMAVRMALGAAPGHLVRSVVVKAVALAGTGVIVGLVFSVLLMRGARSLLFGVAPADPGVLVGASLLLILVALAASYLPARRGARTDPLEVLRSE
jgi:ABC-type antimicrobial peptide transport system permease subunit